LRASAAAGGSFFTKNRHDEQNNFDLCAGL